MLQSYWLMKCKDFIMIMTLLHAQMEFLTLDMPQSKRCNTNNGLSIVSRKKDSISMYYGMKTLLIS